MSSWWGMGLYVENIWSMRASVWTCAFAHVLTLHSLRSLHFASSSARVCLRSTLLFSLCVQMEDRRVPTSHVKGSSRDGSMARSRVSRHRSSAPGWYLCRVLRSRSGRPWLASLVGHVGWSLGSLRQVSHIAGSWGWCRPWEGSCVIVPSWALSPIGSLVTSMLIRDRGPSISPVSRSFSSLL